MVIFFSPRDTFIGIAAQPSHLRRSLLQTKVQGVNSGPGLCIIYIDDIDRADLRHSCTDSKLHSGSHGYVLLHKSWLTWRVRHGWRVLFARSPGRKPYENISVLNIRNPSGGCMHEDGFCCSLPEENMCSEDCWGDQAVLSRSFLWGFGKIPLYRGPIWIPS